MTRAPTPETARPQEAFTGFGSRWDWWYALRSCARQHWVFLSILIAGLLLRVVTQVAYRPALLYIDSFRYLENLQRLDPTKSEMLGYHIFILQPLLAVGNLALVAAVQHVLGLAMGVAIYAVLVHLGVPRWLGALGATPVLLDAYQLQIEQSVMSETLFIALILAAVVILLWRRPATYPVLFTAGALLGVAVTVRVIGGVLVLPAAAFAFVAGGGGWRRLASVAALASAFALPVLLYVGYYHAETGTVGLNEGDVGLLYGRAATIVDCRGLELPRYERKLCPKEPLGHRLGLDVYAHVVPAPRHLHPPPGQTNHDVVRDFARRVFEHQPVDLANAVLNDFVKVFAWGRTTSPGDVSVKRWQFHRHYPVFGASRRYLNDPVVSVRRHGGGGPTVVEPLAAALRRYQLTIGFLPGPVLAAAFVLGILGAVGAGRGRRSGLRAVCALPTLCALSLLLGADLFEFSWRYQLPALTLGPMAGALGLTAVAGWRVLAPAGARPALSAAAPAGTIAEVTESAP